MSKPSKLWIKNLCIGNTFQKIKRHPRGRVEWVLFWQDGKLLTISFRKYITAHGLPTLCNVTVQRHQQSENLKVLRIMAVILQTPPDIHQTMSDRLAVVL